MAYVASLWSFPKENKVNVCLIFHRFRMHLDADWETVKIQSMLILQVLFLTGMLKSWWAFIFPLVVDYIISSQGNKQVFLVVKQCQSPILSGLYFINRLKTVTR